MNIESSNFSRGVEAIVGPYIINDKNQVLLVKSYKWPNKWIVVGGHIEPGETMYDALKRETKEELGVDIEILDIINVGELIGTPPEHHRYAHYIFIDSVAKIVGGEFSFNDEVQEIKWFDIDDNFAEGAYTPSVVTGIEKLREWIKQKS